MKNNTTGKLWTKEFILLMGVTFLSFFCMCMNNPIIPIYVTDKFDCSTTEVGMISGAMIMSAMVVRPFAGYAVDRWGRRWMLFGALAAFMAGNLSLTLPLDIAGLLAIRIFLGIPFAVNTTVLSALVSDIIPDNKRSEGMSYYVILSTLIAASLGASLGLSILKVGSYNAAFIISGIFAILSLLLSTLMRYRDVKNPEAAFSLKSLFEGNVIWLALVQCLSWVGAPGVMTFSTLYAKSAGFTGIGFFYLLYGVGMVSSRFLTGITFNKRGPRIAGIISIGLLLSGYASIGLWHAEAGFLAGGLFLGAGYGLINATLLAMAMQVVRPERRGACSATMFFGQDLGISLGSYFLGLIIDAAGSYNTAYSSAAIFMVFPILLFLSVGIKSFTRKKFTFSVSN